MHKHLKNIIAILILTLVCTGVLWHIQVWNSSGRYTVMAGWIGTSKGLLTTVYDIGVMVILAGGLGFLFGEITDIITKRGGR